MNTEEHFIKQFKSRYIGDDGAYINGLVYSKDAFFENVHFKTSWMSYFQIARKAMLVNISDAIAMNAEPVYALLSVAMPKSITKEQMKELYDGFVSGAKEYDIEIIGGDTIANIKLDITITLISVSKQPLMRTKMKQDDLVAYTGTLGQSSRELKYLLSGGVVHSKSKFIDIKLQKNFIKKSTKFLHSGMDISDGLFSDMGKLSKLNNLGFTFYKKISRQIACSGEEYEMLIVFSKRNKKTLLRLARLSRTKLTIIARVSRKRYINRCKSHHF